MSNFKTDYSGNFQDNYLTSKSKNNNGFEQLEVMVCLFNAIAAFAYCLTTLIISVSALSPVKMPKPFIMLVAGLVRF